jgi:hypothetical protein
MRRKESVGPSKSVAHPEAENLDEINARTLRGKNAPEVIRRTVEAQIEAKAKRRRSRDVPASGVLKKAA